MQKVVVGDGHRDISIDKNHQLGIFQSQSIPVQTTSDAYMCQQTRSSLVWREASIVNNGELLPAGPSRTYFSEISSILQQFPPQKMNLSRPERVYVTTIW